MTEEEVKKFEDGTDIRMSCLEGQPLASVITHGALGLIVQVENDGGIFLLLPEHIIQGATEIQAIDFEEEVKLPTNGDIPDFVKRAIIRLSGGDVNANNMKHTKIGEHVSAFRIEVKNKDNKVEFTGNIGDEVIKRIHSEETCDGVQTAMMLNPDGFLGCAFLQVEPHQVFESVKAMKDTNEFRDIAFTIFQENHDLDESVKIKDCKFFQKIYMYWKGNWWYGILPFNADENGKPVFGEVDWANDIWTERMQMDLALADYFDLDIDYGTAFNGKIKVTKYTENGNGWFYEGTVNQEKLSGKLKAFLTENKLSVNDRGAVNEKLRDMGRVIKMEKDKTGFVTVRSGTFFASERRSKTRAYVEALENLAKSL